jgi:hypothetical protein
MRVAPPCPKCGRVEWLGDGLFISQVHAAASVQRLVIANRLERRWSCMACWYEAERPSALDTLLEEIATTAEPNQATRADEATRVS